MTAVFSDCGRYRYRLDRELDSPLLGTGGRVVFVCLNPSIAGRVISGREITDPTATRMAGFTSAWGYDAFTVVNLFARVSTDPADLAAMVLEEAIGPDNDRHIAESVVGAALVVPAWGSSYPHALGDRPEEVLSYLRSGGPLHHLGLTKGGDPRHPLYLPGDTQPTLWEAW